MRATSGLALLRVLVAAALAGALLVGRAPGPASAEPAGFEHLHTYAEVTETVHRLAAAHPGIVHVFSIGRSYEGRELWAVKISDNPEQNEPEPEVAVGALIHARERMSNEMAMYLLELLTQGYGSNERITAIVDSREIFVLPMLNPDGAEYDISSGRFRAWRKNRQPIPGSPEIGIDLNRQFGFRWACCGGSSPRPRHEMYRGWGPWVAPEARAYRDFVESRVVDGRQQLTGFLNLHSEGRMVLWPYAHTHADLPPTMTADDHRAFVALARQMAEINGYRPRQASAMYIIDGDHDDWLYHDHRIFAFTIELARTARRHYPTRAEIAADADRNRGVFLLFLEQADCYHRAAGLADTHCGPLSDDFEIGRGWQVDPFGTDTASDGAWRRGDPSRSADPAGIRQRGATASGRMALVTGLARGARALANDVDGGLTSARSPSFSLGKGRWTLTFRYTFAHGRRASAEDFLRVSVLVDGERTVLFERHAAASVRNAVWTGASADLSAFAGRTIRLIVEAADRGRGNLLEAALDDVRVFRAP